MKRLLPAVLGLLISVTVLAQANTSSDAGSDLSDFATRMRTVISSHLGRPYVWGATGLKTFDCSGFIWRVMMENGILTKRTTARKFYLSLPKVNQNDRWQFGTLVFFDDLKHVGIVNSKDSFFHAQVSRGTNLSTFDPFWRPKVYGFRAIPAPK